MYYTAFARSFAAAQPLRMRSPRFHLLAIAVAAVLAAPAAVARPRADATQTGGEVRGLWVLRSSLASPASVASMVDTATRSGFNTLLVQVRGRGEAFYRSDLEPRAPELDSQPDTFDPLAMVIDLGHRAGLRVHAWVNVNLVASGATLPRDRGHVAVAHPEWLMVPRPLAESLRRTDPRSPAYIGALARWTRTESERVEGLYLSPVAPASQDYTVSIVRELVSRYAVDGVHLDYIRYPGADFDYSATTLDEFRAQQRPRATATDRSRIDREFVADAFAWTKAYPDAFVAFRQQRLTSLVVRLREAARSVRPELTVSAAVVPSGEIARREKLQDWPDWAARGYLDAVCPMIYTTDETEFGGLIADLQRTLRDVPIWAGIGAYRLSAARTAGNVRIARRAGVAGVLLFSYDSVTGPSALTPNYLATLRPVLLESPAGGTDRR